MISDEEAKEWAYEFIEQANQFYEFSDIYEDEEFTEEYPDEEDWKKVYDFMTTAKIFISWDDEGETE